MKYMILIASLFLTVNAAERLADDYPYFVFQDGNKIRYCMEPATVTATRIDCWANGIKETCDIVSPDQGWIDCG